jgi:hypothetical protein
MQAALRQLSALSAMAVPVMIAAGCVPSGAAADPLAPSPYQVSAYPSLAQGTAPVQAQPPYPAPAGRALPPPPYARDGEARAGSTVRYPAAYDRYGGGTAHRSAQLRPTYAADRNRPPMEAPSAAYTGPRLNWSGKTAAAPAPQRPAVYAQYTNTPQAREPVRAYAPPPPDAQSAAPPAPTGWRYLPPIGAAPTEPATQAAASARPAPRSIYDTPPPAAAPAPVPMQQTSAVAAPNMARHYSVHREYGQAPDPIPLPPQFFGATADLTQPETGEPARRTVTGNGKSHNALQSTEGQ